MVIRQLYLVITLLLMALELVNDEASLTQQFSSFCLVI